MKLPEPNLINKYPTPGHYTTEQMLAWGKACAAAEREECAKLIEAYPEWLGVNAKQDISAAIRARGNT